MSHVMFLTFTLSAIFVSNAVLSAKILFLFPMATKSETVTFQALVKGLAARGHEVTVITPVVSGKPITNITEIFSVLTEDFTNHLGNIFEGRKKGRLALFASLDVSYIAKLSAKVYEKKEFQEAIAKKYDLIFISGFSNEAFYGVIAKMQVPFIILISIPAPDSITQYTGNQLPPSFVSTFIWDFSDRMTFRERLGNYLLIMLLKMNPLIEDSEKLYRHHLGQEVSGLKDIMKNVSMVLMNGHFSLNFPRPNLPDNIEVGGMHCEKSKPLPKLNVKFENIYRSYLGAEISSVEAIIKNVSLILSNAHFLLNYPRPSLPDNIEVEGMHCDPAKPLAKDLDDFVSGAEHGFIFFSLGSVVKSADMPEETRKVFLNVFGRLKQRVLWKWENDDMTDLPKNVMVRKWLPQQDILGHPNIKIFMTHGGLLSTQEAAYHGVPLLGFPIFFDQDLNVKQSVQQGYALFQEILDMTETELEEKIRILLDDPKYRKRAKELSAIVKDQMETPLERAIFWSEYVIRHKGAKHLRSGARDLNYFQYHSYDVIGFLALIIGTILSIIGICVVKLIKCCGRGAITSKAANYKKHN